MSIKLDLKRKDVDKILQNPPKIHFIPATISASGPASVEKYFDAYTEQLEDNTLQNSLRGYPLRGKRSQLPDGYTGIVFQETKKPLSSDEDRNFTLAGAFREFTYWNYDRIPSRNDPFTKALNWLELSEALHGDVAVQGTNNDTVKKEKQSP